MSFSATPNGPRGLTPVRAQSGVGNRTNEYQILGTYGTKIYSGQPVTLFTDGYVRVLAAAANFVLGVFDGCEYIDVNGDTRFSPYWPAPGAVKTGTTVKARVYDNADELFLMKATADITQAQVGEYADLDAIVGGDDTTGKSTISLDAANTDATVQTSNVVVINEVSKRPGSSQEVIVQLIRPRKAAAIASV